MRLRLRQVAWPGGLVVAALLVSCSGTAARPTAVSLESAETPGELRGVLETIKERDDPESWICRARIYGRLRDLEGESPRLLSLGDGADLRVLEAPAPPELKAEASDRLGRHFIRRSREAAISLTRLEGPLACSLRRFAMAWIAAAFGEYNSPEAHAEALRSLATAAQVVAESPGLRAERRGDWIQRAQAASLQAAKAAVTGGSPSPRTRRFCESTIERLLDEGGRAADAGTREKAMRGAPERVAEWYLTALFHYVLARECLTVATASQERALSSLKIVVRTLTDIYLEAR